MVWTVLAIIVLCQLALPLGMLVARDRLIFFPSARPTTAEGLAWIEGVEAEVLEVRRLDGLALAGYDARPPGAPDAPLLLFLHGNAGNAALRAPWLGQFARDAGVRVVLASYAGYGGNGGRPSEADLHMDALAFFDRVVADGVDPRGIVLYGESIGAAAALRLAGERPCAGVIAQAPFASLASMVRRVYPWLPLAPLLAGDAYPNAERAAALSVPLLVVHGTADEIIPFAEGERVHVAAPGSELWPIEGAGHNDLFEAGGPEFARKVGVWVRRWAGGGTGGQ